MTGMRVNSINNLKNIIHYGVYSEKLQYRMIEFEFL
jgi:hypothetical protein